MKKVIFVLFFLSFFCVAEAQVKYCYPKTSTVETCYDGVTSFDRPIVPLIVVQPTPTVTPSTPLVFDASALQQQILALQQQLTVINDHITAVDTKFDAYEQNPPWLKKFFTNYWPEIMSAAGGIGACIITKKC